MIITVGNPEAVDNVIKQLKKEGLVLKVIDGLQIICPVKL